MSPVIVGGKQQQGHSLLISAARLMKVIATEYNIAFLVTNHSVSGGEDNRNKLRAGLGESWTFVPNTQLTLYNKRNVRYACLTKSSRLSCDLQGTFQIQADGVK